MAYDRFIIAPINTGLEQDLRPWLIPDDAFTELNNAYVFRGRVIKRFGGRLMGSTDDSFEAPFLSRFRVLIGTTDGIGDIAGTIPGHIVRLGMQFTIGIEVFTVVDSNPGLQNMLDTGASTVAQFDITTGNYDIQGATPLTSVFFYPALPVMGLTIYEKGPINNQPTFGFDEEFAYRWAVNGWVRSNTGLNPEFHGTSIDFFWTTNWEGITAESTVLFVTNDFIQNVTGSNSVSGVGAVTDDAIWTYDGTNWSPFTFNPGNPPNNQPITVTRANAAGDTIESYVQSARIILPFKDRLILLNTIENNANGATPFPGGITPANYVTSTNTQFKNRCRYSHNGSPFANNAWLEKNQVYNPGGALPPAEKFASGGGFLDAATEEQIISAEFIKDRLIVFFERSTWELVYTGNEVLPFRWQKINTELGSEASFSTVPFDKVVLTMGTTGVHACNGSNVERIDFKIPNTVFQIKNKDLGVERVAGIRDFFAETTYWTFPSSNEDPDFIFPNRVLVYNYKNGSWALNNDCITCFGNFQQQTDITWESTILRWEEYDSEWNSGILQPQFRQIIAGNQQGFVFIVDTTATRNAPVMTITNIFNVLFTTFVDLLVIDHTLAPGDYIYIQNCQGILIPAPGSRALNNNIWRIQSVDIANNTVRIGPDATFIGFYTGGGVISRVSRISIDTKQFNPYVDKGRNVYIAKADFCVIPTASGEITVDYSVSGSSISMIEEGSLTGSLLGTNVLQTFPQPNTFELFQDRLWHPVYFQSAGEFVQLFISLSDAQMLNPDIAFSDFELEGIVLYTQPTDYRLE